MVFPIARNPNKTMFPLRIFDLKSYAEDCKRKSGVVPRPNWVTTEYGGHVSAKLTNQYVCLYILTKAFSMCFIIICVHTGHTKGAETLCEQHHFLQWFVGSMEQWGVIHSQHISD